MRTSSVVAASAALVAGANAWGNVTYTTEVVTAYTTYCPSSTEVVHGTKTYTVTEVSDFYPLGNLAAGVVTSIQLDSRLYIIYSIQANSEFLRPPHWSLLTARAR